MPRVGNLQMMHFASLFNHFKTSTYYPEIKSPQIKKVVDRHNDYFENYDLFCGAHCGYNATLKTHQNNFTKSKKISKLHLWHSNTVTDFYKLKENDERKNDTEKWFGFQLQKDATFNGCVNERKFLLLPENGSYAPTLTSDFTNTTSSAHKINKHLKQIFFAFKTPNVFLYI